MILLLGSDLWDLLLDDEETDMGRRMHARTPGGRFTRATMENTLGLHVYVCTDCRRMNPVPVGGSKPETCHACGSENLK
jgi:hypothetical protein